MLNNCIRNNLNNLQNKKDYCEIASTNQSSQNQYPVQANSSGLEDFKKKFKEQNFLIKYLDKNCPLFNEDFELIKFISTGGTGVVYEGQMRKKKNKQKLAFKFKYSKKHNEDKEEFQEIGILKKTRRFRKVHENPS